MNIDQLSYYHLHVEKNYLLFTLYLIHHIHVFVQMRHGYFLYDYYVV